MELNFKSIDNKTWRNVGLIALAAGALYYPAYRLYKYLAKRNKTEGVDEPHKSFAPSYRKNHKPHHRHHMSV